MRWIEDINKYYSQKLQNLVEERGYVLEKDLHNRCGYCYIYTLKNSSDSIEIASYSSVEGFSIMTEERLSKRILNGEPDYEKEFEKLYGGI